MKRSLALLVLIGTASMIFAQSPNVIFEKPFRPVSPVVVGQGGSFTANGSGWDAFFTNPAALAGQGSLTLASINPWIYSTGDMLKFVLAYAGVGQVPGLLGSVSGRAITTLTMPAGFVPPADNPDYQTQLLDLVNNFLAQTDAGGVLSGVTEVVIPASWLALDPAAIGTDYAQLAPYINDFLAANPAIETAIGNQLASQVLPPGFPTAPKLRFGTSAGLGLIVKGFGLGVAAILDASVQGDTILQTTGDATLTLGFMAGYALELKLSDHIGLKVGGLLRPMFRVTAPVRVSGLLSAFAPGGGFDAMGVLDTLLAYYGTGLGIDVGAILGVGPFSVGLAVTDLFDTRFNYQASTFRRLYDSLLQSQSLPTGDSVTAKHVIPMDVRVGAAFHPDLGVLSFLIDPTVHMEIGNFLTLARRVASGEHLTVRLGDIAAFGAEVRILRFLKLRAGYYQGALSAGIGAKLLFIDANVAAYVAPKNGTSVGLSSAGLSNLGDVGITAELALRF